MIDPAVLDVAEKRRAERIFRERVNGTYAEHVRVAFERLIATRDAGMSEKRVKNPFIRPATPAMLRGVGRNDRCPCGSGRKTKWCCTL